MRFTVSAAALMAFVSSALAQNPAFNPITRPSEHEKVPAGSTFEIQWTAPAAFSDVKVTITLIGGPEQNKQQPLEDIASGVTNSVGKYSWAVGKGLGTFPWYGIKIASEVNPTVDFQYSQPFDIVPLEGGSGNDTTTTVTTGTGTKTVSLSSASKTDEPSTTAAPTHGGNSTVSPPPKTTITTVVGGGSGPSTTTTIATVSRPAGGAQATAGAFALLGGLAIAALAL